MIVYNNDLEANHQRYISISPYELSGYEIGMELGHSASIFPRGLCRASIQPSGRGRKGDAEGLEVLAGVSPLVRLWIIHRIRSKLSRFDKA
jgi:hypothetical protein